ncbi:DNA-3-methyladenine glycosylase I [Neorhodopirellula pilleata]|uniref:DNA-3-methyladenine glycosylase 1 n=1 Tax=Neorhodopirellula pilleata TaxID=2714738 RepID=A0A5C6A4D5_9BACT|nr:DNA-3-methyladenine glycosylase I [Neorhodopirellula pilleata]TWT94255.1 DNA-3-methyladenine glycosylase 1 [Neorhodopirellula pilleata]
MLIDEDLITGDDGRKRCRWCVGDPLYQSYHDLEWGVPVSDDHRLFEKICLEGFQCGLSWLTILKRREGFRRAFADFRFDEIAQWDQRQVNRLVKDSGIIRHRGKIAATLHNASRAIEMRRDEGSLLNFFSRYLPDESPVPGRLADLPAITDESTRMSRELKKRGWKFVGPTTCYAFMQAMGMVNDHLADCDFRSTNR